MNAGDIYQKKSSPSSRVRITETFQRRVPPADSFDAAHPDEWYDLTFVRYQYEHYQMGLDFEMTQVKFEAEYEPATEIPPVGPKQQVMVGRLVMLDRGMATNIEGATAPSVLVGGVLVRPSGGQIVQDPDKAELWEVEVTITPLRKLRDFKDGNGATLEHILIAGLANDDMWREQ